MNAVNVTGMRMPLTERLLAASGGTRFHMPGHGGRLPEWLSAALDTTELPATDDLHEPGDAILAMQELMAARAGAAFSLALASGATVGVQAMVLSGVPRGGTVVMSRASHVSAWNACALNDLDVVCAQPAIKDGWAVTPAKSYIEAMERTPRADAVLVTAPDYLGLTPDIDAVADVAKKRDIKLLVDAAHGAHRPWLAERDAIADRAEMWVHSAHKNLPALTGGAWLHVKSAARRDAAMRALRLLTTTSPSFLILASLDYARAWMEEQGRAAISGLKEFNAELARVAARAGMPTMRTPGGFSGDPLRVRLNTAWAGRTGYELEREMSARGVHIEMAARDFALFLPPLTSVQEDYDRLFAVLKGLASRPPLEVPPYQPLPLPERAMRLSLAALGEAEAVAVGDAVGRIAASPVGLYPPGVPLVVPGELIDARIIERIRASQSAGEKIFGLNGQGMAWITR